MPSPKKPASSIKQGAAKAPAKPKPSAKKPIASAAVPRQKPAAVIVAKPPVPKKASSPKKASLNKTEAKVSVSRTSNPRSTTVTIKKITRNIVQFHMTEEIEIRRVTKSDNMSKEKLKAKYADLKAKVKSR